MTLTRPLGAALAALAGLALTGCASLATTAPEVTSETVQFGFVTAKSESRIKTDETRLGRAAVSAVSLNPVAVAAAVVALEKDFGTTNVFDYEIALYPGPGGLTLRSPYPAALGSCVMIRTDTTSGRVMLIEQEPKACGDEPAKDR